ncbi:MAG TPA: Flp pilus assembly protein CpaB [Phycisphaerae bacterium]|nr:Flp pilus assembly protein CpaB [Phycisphaerae bacterium]
MAENQASRAFLVGAVVLGVLATIMAFIFIQSTAGVDRGPHVRIVVAARDLRANASIDPERDLKVIEIPVKFASLASESLDADAKATYKGQRVNRRILASQPIFLADLAAVGTLDIKEPYRAMSIPADAGLVIPGDRVQILVAQPDAGAMGAPVPGQPARSSSGLLVANGKAFRVLAVGGELKKTRSQATNADQMANTASAKMVTLEVTPEEAAQLVGAISTNPARNMLLICPPATPVSEPTTNP